MTKRPWHEQLAALVPFPWWFGLVLGIGIAGQAVGTLVRAALGDDSVGGSDMAWAVVGVAGGTWWLAFAYAKRRHRDNLGPP